MANCLEGEEFEDNLLTKLLDMGCRKLAMWLIKYNPDLVFTEILIKRCIIRKQYIFLNWLFKSNSKRVRDMMLSEAVFFKFLKQLDSENNFLHSLHLLYSFRNEKLSFFNIRIVTEKFSDIFQQNKPLLLNCLSPLVASVIISDLFLKLSRANYTHSIKLIEVAKKYRDLAVLLENEIDENLLLKYVLLTDVFPLEKKRPLIDIIFEEREFFLDLLTNPVIVDIFKRKWHSSYSFDNNILVSSSALSIMNHSGEEEQVKHSKSNKIAKKKRGSCSYISRNLNVFKFTERSSLEKVLKTNHVYQYITYTHSSALKIFFELMFFLIIFVIVIYSLMNYLVISEPVDMMKDEIMDFLVTRTFPENFTSVIQNNVKNMEIWMRTKYNATEIFLPKMVSTENVISLRPEEYQDFCYNILLVATQTPSFYSYFSNDCYYLVKFLSEMNSKLPLIQGAFYLVIFLGSYSLIQMVYYYLLHKKFRFSSFYIADLITVGCGILCLHVIARIRSESISKELFRNMSPMIKLSCTLTVFLMWIKFISYIKMTQSFGVLIKITYLMFKDVSYFLTILGLIYVSFASIFYIMYQSYYSEHSTFLMSLRQLIGSSMGGFMFYVEGNDFNKISSSALTIFFIFITNIVLLNLLIAILSNTYSVIISRSNIEYSFILYDSYKTQKYHRYYGAILLFPPPLSAVSFVLLPFVVFFKSERLNQTILRASYLVLLIFYMLIFNVANLLFAIPMAYVHMTFRILFSDYMPSRIKRAEKYPTRRMILRTIHLIIWILLGVPFLIKTHFTNDLAIFCRSAFKKVDNREKLREISLIDYRLIKNIYRTGLREKLESITKEEFYQVFKENLLKTGSIQAKQQHFAKNVEPVSNNLVVKLDQVQLLNIEEEENENREYELDIMEAKNFITNFSLKGKVSISYLGKFFEVIKMKKKKKKKGVKRYPYLLEIVNLEKARLVFEGKKSV